METPQLSKAAFWTGISGEIFTRCAISTTVYSEKLETKRKWWISSPIESLNLEAIPYRLVFDIESLAYLAHQLLFEDLQSLHSSQLGWNTGNTTSPCLNPSTCSPTLSTKLVINPIITIYLSNNAILTQTSKQSTFSMKLKLNNCMNYSPDRFVSENSRKPCKRPLENSKRLVERFFEQ